MLLCVVLVQQAQEKSLLWIVMELVEHIASKASFPNAWNPGLNTSSVIPGHDILLLLSKVATLYYFWVLMRWPVHPMESCVIQSLQRPGTTPGSTIRWWVKAASSQQSLAVGMFQLSSSQAMRRPAARLQRF